jgi:hypothetical protein
MITTRIVEAGDRSKVHFEWSLPLRMVLPILRLKASKKRTKIEQVTREMIVLVTGRGKRRTLFSGAPEEMDLLVDAVDRAREFGAGTLTCGATETQLSCGS